MLKAWSVTVGAVVLAGNALATELRVPSQYPTIKAAITAAVNGDTVIIENGVYGGAGNVGLSFAGKAITVRSENGPAACTIDAAHASVIFTFSSGEGPLSLLEGITLRQGNGTEGGAVRCSGASPTIRGCVFDNGWGSYHGAGVGCVNGSAPRIENCTFRDGLAGVGAAVYALSGSHPKMIGCSVRGHRTDLFGAAGAGCDAASALTIDRCVFQDNLAMGFSPYGGAVLVGGTATITNSLFLYNTAGAGGGAIACVNGSNVSIVNCTFYGNSAGSGTGGGGGAVWSQAATPSVTSSILWVNVPDEIGGNPLVSYSVVNGGWPGAGNLNVDPGFWNSPGNDFHLAPSSPCIDAGNSGAIPPALTLDLDGLRRRVDDPATPDTGLGPAPVIDIGAYELQVDACYADCNESGTLTIADFACFQSRFVLGEPYADCNQSGTHTIADFACFQAEFVGGCP